jgi:hypothetical protein
MRLINWDKVIPVIKKMSELRTYEGIVTQSIEDYQWFSTLENRSRIEWTYQLQPSTVKLAINHLSKTDLLTSKSRGIYVLNKNYLL